MNAWNTANTATARATAIGTDRCVAAFNDTPCQGPAASINDSCSALRGVLEEPFPAGGPLASWPTGRALVGVVVDVVVDVVVGTVVDGAGVPPGWAEGCACRRCAWSSWTRAGLAPPEDPAPTVAVGVLVVAGVDRSGAGEATGLDAAGGVVVGVVVGGDLTRLGDLTGGVVPAVVVGGW